MYQYNTAAPAIDEESARRAHEAISFRPYKEGAATKDYTNQVKALHDLADRCKAQLTNKTDIEKIDNLVTRGEVIAAQTINNYNHRSERIPSVMITGPSNYPAAKMQKRIDAMMRAYESDQEKYERIIEAIKKVGKEPQAISSADPKALDLLTAKLNKLKQEQENMKRANKEARKVGKEAPYASFTLANRNKRIKSIEQRIATIEQVKKMGNLTKEGTFLTGDEFEYTRDTDEGYYYFEFASKPSAETRDMLKHKGFHWSPSNDRWQRKITGDASYAVRAIFLSQVKTSK